MGRVKAATFCSEAPGNSGAPASSPAPSSLSRGVWVVGSIFHRDQALATFSGLPEVPTIYGEGFTVSRFIHRGDTQPFLLPPVAVLETLSQAPSFCLCVWLATPLV